MLIRQRLPAIATSLPGLILLATLFGTGIHFFTKWLFQSGHFILDHDLSRDYLVALGWAFVIFLGIEVTPIPAVDKKALVRLWFARCLVTLGFMLWYENHYDLDAYGYFANSLARNFDWNRVGFQNGTVNIEAIAWAMNHYLPILDSYHPLKVCFSAIGLVSVYLFYRATVLVTGKSDTKYLYLLGLLPSALFWSSILGKDPIEFFGIALYAYGAVALQKTGKIKYIFYLFIGITLASWIRSWSAVILIPPLFLVGTRAFKRTGARLVAILVFSVLFFYAVQFFVGRFRITDLDGLVQTTNALAHSWNFGGSSLEVPEFHSISQMILFAPLGMFTALFRPLPGEVLNFFGLLAGLENLFLVYLLYLAVRNFNRKLLGNPYVRWAVSLVILWSFLYGFISFQNLGSAFRFRLQILPILLALLLAHRNEDALIGENK